MLCEPMPFQLASHVDVDSWPEWGSSPRGPVIALDMAHRGELMDTVIGMDPATGKDRAYLILRCEMCILTHLWPLPSQEALDRWYAESFYQHEKPDMIHRYLADADWWTICVHGRLLDTAWHALATPTRHAPHILDIGAGPGLLLRTAKAHGWQTTAIEPSPLCAGRLVDEGHAVWMGTLTDYLACPSNAATRYDIVTLYEVLEHVANPEDTLLQVYDLLKPGGVVFFCCPNDWNPLQLAACKQWGLPHYWLSAPAHIHYFSPKTAQLLLRRTGFTLVDCRSSYPLETFLLSGRQYVGHDDVGRLCHEQRMREELADICEGRWADREAQYRANLTQRIGRELLFWGQKPV